MPTSTHPGEGVSGINCASLFTFLLLFSENRHRTNDHLHVPIVQGGSLSSLPAGYYIGDGTYNRKEGEIRLGD